ncbi:MAG: SMP-30/gluconolactonase/LRE family protein, partial [Actinomycetota bacterium]|nr:SMP-30/gluconolactonase/LRE family protein [Actinomycetota bacterium]
MSTTRTLLADLGFPEGPRWRDGRLWFSDFHDQRVRAVAADGTAQTVLQLDDAPSGLGWSPAGELLVVSMQRRALLRVTEGGPQVVAELGSWVPGPVNDMVVDSTGAAYIGNFGFDLLGGAAPQPTALLRVAPDGEVSVAAEDLHFPNGMCLADGGRTLVVAETYGQRLTAFDVGADGGLSRRRVFAELEAGVAPDGICLDAEGQVWVATART